MPRIAEKVKIEQLHDIIFQQFRRFKDPRMVAQISLENMLMASLAVFTLKCPSLLSFEREFNEPKRVANLKKLFRMERIPSDTQLRDVLDKVDYLQYRIIFKKIFAHIQRAKIFELFQFMKINNEPHHLLAVDGTGYYRSEKIRYEHCMDYSYTSVTGEEVVKYGHNMLAASFVSPNLKTVIPVFPEPIANEDGSTKNDCEQNAFKRFIKEFRREHPKLKVIFSLDALYATRPIIELIREASCEFIIAVKNSKSSMYRGVKRGLFEGKTKVLVRDRTHGEKVIKKTITTYRYMNKVRLHQDVESPLVNFLDVTEVTTWNGKRGPEREEKRFAYITDIAISNSNLEELAKGGRTRWSRKNQSA